MNRVIENIVVVGLLALVAYSGVTAYATTRGREITVRDDRGAVVGYIEAFESGDVFDSRHKKIGYVNANGTYDAQGHKLLDQPLPGWLLATQGE